MIRNILLYISSFIGLLAITFYIISYIKYKPSYKKTEEKNLPFVSIIIPAWNEENGISTTIESILGLDYPKNKFEIIVVDDGSKDNTYKRALKYKSSFVKVFRKSKNGGKYSAMNFAIKKAKGEIIVSTDADKLHISRNALRDMVQPFVNKRVMCVAPAMAINNPYKVLTRVQQVEYLLGVFLRKAFASVNAIHITPGAFSAYRKSFFEKYGGFKRAHLTEDMEMAIRIQSHHFIIENVANAVVYTEAPTKFIPLLKQRRRWYVGLLRNLYDYKYMFSTTYGALGILVLPTAVFSIVISLILSTHIFTTGIGEMIRKFRLLKLINFDIFHAFKLNMFFIQRAVFETLIDPLFIFATIFICILIGYMIFAKRWIKKNSNIKVSLIIYIVLYPVLFLYWWIDAIIHATLLNKRVTWR